MSQSDNLIDKYQVTTRLSIEWVGVLNYSLMQSAIPFINQIILINEGEENIQNSRLKIQFEFDYIDEFEEELPLIESGQIVGYRPNLSFRGKKIFEMSEGIQDHMTVTWYDKTGEILNKTEYYFDILPMNQWTGSKIFPESIASFVLPNIPKVMQLQKRAAHFLKEKTGSSAFTGYLTEDKTDVLNQMAAIYAAIYEQNVSYAISPADFYAVGQRVRTPQEVLEYKMGNCIEMAVLYASLAEACGLNPFIVMVKGHAFVGVWLKEALFEENFMTDFSEVSKRLSNGINDIEVLEATYMNEGKKKTFDQAIRSARGIIEEGDTFEGIVDIRRSHYIGLRPMPIFVEHEGETRLVDYGLAEDAEDKAVNVRTVEEYFLDTNQKEEFDKSKIWMRNLLDLSKRNNLISFRPSPKSIQLFNADLSQLEDALSNGQSFLIKDALTDWERANKKVNFVDVESNREIISQLSQVEFKGKRLRTFLSQVELESRLKTLYRETRHSIEENGSSSLFLAAGFLRWIDPKDFPDEEGNQMGRLAPIVMLPVDLVRKNGQTYYLQLRDEDAQMNITLLEMLRQNFKLNIAGLNPLPEDEAGIDLPLVFNSIRKAVMDRKGWDVIEVAFLGNFSFSQFVMWDDLNKRFDRLLENKVIKALVEGRYTDYSSLEMTEAEIENTDLINQILVPSDTDASQLMAIAEAVNGTSFVLHGPPGTGKSQTIMNMIANALYHGKSVLFVAEKMAALNVVSDRLNKIGLGDYLLEIHSNKTRKQVVLDKLGQNIEMPKKEDDDIFERQIEKISSKRKILKEIIKEIHIKQSIGKSIYELIEWRERLVNFPSEIKFSVEDLTEWDQIKWEASLQAVHRLSAAAEHLSVPVVDHPLKLFTKASYELQKRDQLKTILYSLSNLLEQLIRDSSFGYYGWIQEEARRNRLLSLCRLYLERNIKLWLNENIWTVCQDMDFLQEVKELIQELEGLSQQQTRLEGIFIENLETIKWQELKTELMSAQQSFILVKGKNIKRALLPIKAVVRANIVIDEELALTYLEQIGEYQQGRSRLNQQVSQLSQRISYQFNQVSNPEDEIKDLYYLLDFIHSYGDDTLLEDINFVQNQMKLGQGVSFLSRIESFHDIMTEFIQLTGYDRMEDDVTAQDFLNKVTKWLYHVDEWKEWSTYYQNVEALERIGLGSVSEYLMKSDQTLPLEKVYLSSILPVLIQYYVGKSNGIRNFSGHSYEMIVEEFNLLMDEYEDLVRQQIVMRLSRNIPDVKTCSDLEARQIAQLKKAVQSKGRGMSIRKIFQDNSEVIKKLTPCLLMSPLSVAQYIDMDFPKFDLVIFDEASQIRTSTAIGAMSRAENCIIVGDPQQMPPTSFFSTTKVDEDNLFIEDLESLLEDCLAVNMPQRYLTHHYRSQSESLISFSNSMYYDNKMITFPSPLDRVSKVTYHDVKGIYDRGNTRTNKIEAERVVKEIKQYVLSNTEDSIGVITFNLAQQNLIEDLVQKEVAKDANFETKLNQMSEPLFIKNLENVQGDERDNIIFSIGYGPDESGKFYQNFGPLARTGGWRRLNVAVSRSRKEMKIIASIKPEEINVTARSSEGVKGLKAFLTFAQTGALSISKKKNEEADGIIQSIVKVIEAKGFEADTCIGASEFKVSIALIHPQNPNLYCGAIRIDDGTYADVATTPDRVRLIPHVLERKGWKVHQVWSLDWFENKAREERKIQEFLQGLDLSISCRDQENHFEIGGQEIGGAAHQTKEKEDKQTSVNPEEILSFENGHLEMVSQSVNVYQEKEVESEGIVQVVSYQSYPVEMVFEAKDFKNQFTEDVELAQAIVDLEAPIHEMTLKRKILGQYDKVKMTRATDEYLTSVIKKIKTKKRNEEGAYFYWGQIDYRRYKVFRQQEKPDLSSVSLIEMSNGLNTLVPIQGVISVEEVYKQFSKILGYSRTTDAMITYYEKALNVLKRQKLITIKKGQISRVDKR